MVREIAEELTYSVPTAQFELLARYDGRDIDIEREGRLDYEVFLVRDIPANKLIVTEGTLFKVRPGDIAALDSRLTPLARFALGEFEKR